MTTKITKNRDTEYVRKRFLSLIYIGLITTPMHLISSHPVSNQERFSVARVSHFPFYQHLANPCRMNHASPVDTSTPENANQSVFSLDFVLSMGLAINLTLDAVESLENKNSVPISICHGISLDSLPVTPAMKTKNELKLMSQSYKSGLFLAAHLHIVLLDRQLKSLDEINEVSDENDAEEEEQDVLLCENESSNYVSLLQDMTLRMENLLCTLVTGANLEQRASFRRPLQQLEKTKIFRYHSSCTALQTRDCVVLHESKQYLLKLRSKFKKLILQHQPQSYQQITQSHHNTTQGDVQSISISSHESNSL